MKTLRSALVALALAAATTASLQEGERKGPPEVGDSVPSFRLNDHEGNAVAVGGANERWTVVAFYPKALTPG